MRPAAIAALVLSLGAASSAGAQSLSASHNSDVDPAAALARSALTRAAFAPSPRSVVAPMPVAQPKLAGAPAPVVNPGAHPLPPSNDYRDGLGTAVQDYAAQAAASLTRQWTTGETAIAQSATRVDSVRVSMLGSLRPPSGVLRNPDDADFQADAYEVAVIRNWPGAVRFDTRRFDVDLTPHAGVGMTSYGGSAEAGATLRLSQRLNQAANAKLKELGVTEGSASFGDDVGRWYLYAAASGRAVGMNMLRNENGWDQAGWTTDPTSTLVGDAQVGVGWRKGLLQSSLGYMHREVKGQHMIFGQKTREDSMVAFTLSLKPGR